MKLFHIIYLQDQLNWIISFYGHISTFCLQRASLWSDVQQGYLQTELHQNKLRNT